MKPIALDLCAALAAALAAALLDGFKAGIAIQMDRVYLRGIEDTPKDEHESIIWCSAYALGVATARGNFDAEIK